MNLLPAVRNSDPIALGETMHKSGMFPDTKSAAAACVKILAGEEYGLGPVAAMSGIHVIDNKPVPGATVLAGCVKRSGRYDYKIKAHDNTRCVLGFWEGGEYVGESAFTFEDAKKAGLAGRTNWQRYPRNMLFARALANGVRWYCPDVTQTGVVLTAEEVADEAQIEYVPAGATAEPVAVVNEAAPVVTISAEWVARLQDLYVDSGWVDVTVENADDAHNRIRMELLGMGVDNQGSVETCLGRLTEQQAGELAGKLKAATG